MSDAPSPEMPRRLLSDLCRLVADRASVEGQLETQFTARNSAVEKESQEAQARLDERYHREKAAAEEQYASLRTTTAAKFEADTAHSNSITRSSAAKCSPALPPTCRPPSRPCRTRIGRRWRTPTRPGAG